MAMVHVADYAIVGLDRYVAESVALLIANVLTVLSVLLLRFFNFSKNDFKSVSVANVCMMLVGAFPVVVALSILSEVGEVPDYADEFFRGIIGNPFGLASVCLMAPIAEEVLFRGAIQGHLLSEGWNPWRAIFISAALFSLVHGNPVQMLAAFPMGVVLGWIAWRTGSIVLPVILHVVNNTVSCVMYRTGFEDASFVEWLEMQDGMLIALSFVLFALSFLIFYFFDRKIKSQE